MILGDQAANVPSNSELPTTSAAQQPQQPQQPFKAPPSVIVSKKRKERPRREQESPEKQGQEVSSGHSRKRSSATKDTGGTASQLDYRKSFGGKSEKFTRFVFKFFCPW